MLFSFTYIFYHGQLENEIIIIWLIRAYQITLLSCGYIITIHDKV